MTEKLSNELEKFRDFVEAYGADTDRWPEDRRHWAQAVASQTPEAETLLREAEAVDRLLDLAPPPEEDTSALMRRILADAPAPSKSRRRWAEQIWPFGPVWIPAGGLVLASVLGAIAGWDVFLGYSQFMQQTAEVDELLVAALRLSMM